MVEMDATVTDFLNEINQIAPKKEVKQQEVWQECYDELTGYSYYWNTVTDEVTWTTPKLFKPAQNNPKRASQSSQIKPSHVSTEKKPTELYVPPSTQLNLNLNPEAKNKIYSLHDTKPKEVKELYIAPSTPQYKSQNLDSGIKNKLYSVQDTTQKEAHKSSGYKAKNHNKPIKKKHQYNPGDSDDEKIELITEYGKESDSESEDLKIPNEKQASLVKQNDSLSEEEEDDIDLLAKIQQRAKELKKLGGEVPPEVKNIIQKTHTDSKDEKPNEKHRALSGFSLVAGYNSSDGESEEEEEPKLPSLPIFPLAPPPEPSSETSHSTLFPITQPIDVKDFIGPNPEPPDNAKAPENATGDGFDSKAFQRKRRIGISLVNSVKRLKEDEDSKPVDSEFKGFGFKTEIDQNLGSKTDQNDATKMYHGFQKGGVMFVKSDNLNPILPEKENKVPVPIVHDRSDNVNIKKTEDLYTVLSQKLEFLGEGRPQVLPVQVMLIQAETLFIAMKEGGLKLSYLHSWLQETSSQLIKLEKQAAPEGWLLQWDRSNSRYFYQNQTTGESQWEYPQPDISRCDDAMDISTTPPPPDLPEPPTKSRPESPVVFGPHLPVKPPLPPSPPKIRAPTPPPPPMISLDPTEIYSDVPLPPEVILPPLPPPNKAFESGEPLPPGVDIPEAAGTYHPSEESEADPSSLSSALDSFYSEIAESNENTNSNSPTSSSQIPDALEDFSTSTGEVLKKKKKKVKLAPGLSLKKKGVSQLVEKWKNVQKNY